MEFLREENLRQAEELLQKAVEKAKMSGISLEELADIMKMLYNE